VPDRQRGGLAVVSLWTPPSIRISARWFSCQRPALAPVPLITPADRFRMVVLEHGPTTRRSGALACS